MASYSYPSPSYNGGALTDLEYERLASPQAVDGMVGSPADAAPVWADGVGTRRVYVGSQRRALVRGFHYDSGASTIDLTLAANSSGVNRVDLIVLRLDRSTWTVTEAVVQGTPGAGPPTRTLNTGSIGVWEFPLAEVTVTSGASTITAGQVVRKCWYVGASGQVLCTSTTRPDHEAGMRVWETDTTRWLLSTGASWVVLFEDTGWVDLAAVSGWSVDICQWRRRSGIVAATVSVTRSAGNVGVNVGAVLANLPAGSRPTGSGFTTAAVMLDNPGTVSRVDIGLSGAVTRVSGPAIATGQRIAVYVTFPV